MERRVLLFRAGLLESLVEHCREILPAQAFGLLAGREPDTVDAIHVFTRNRRPEDPAIDALFRSYGEFYASPERGFWADPAEQLSVLRAIDAAGHQPTAVFHSHRLLPASPTRVDRDLHYDPTLPAVIVSFAAGDADVRAFRFDAEGLSEVPLVVAEDPMRPRAAVEEPRISRSDPSWS